MFKSALLLAVLLYALYSLTCIPKIAARPIPDDGFFDGTCMLISLTAACHRLHDLQMDKGQYKRSSAFQEITQQCQRHRLEL